MRLARLTVALAVGATILVPSSDGFAQQLGYQLNRYEVTPAGEHFLAVEHPWYSSLRYFAGGVTLDYANNLLVQGTADANGKVTRTRSIVEHQLAGHVDLAGSLWDRVALHFTMPFIFMEKGNAVGPAYPSLAPIGGVAIGDPRFGVRARLVGQHEDGPIGLSLGFQIWVPISRDPNSPESHAGDNFVRFNPKLMAGGVIADIFRWTLNAGFLFRKTSAIAKGVSGDYNTLGSEVQIGAGAQITLLKKTLSFGPELLVSFAVPADGAIPSKQQLTNLEILGSLHYLIAENLVVHVGGGGGLMGTPGPPDARAMLRLAYAPRKAKEKKVEAPPDRDLDGIYDPVDACPDEKGIRTDDPKTNGCPPPKDRDKDGVLDDKDLCPDVPQGPVPDPARLGCPAKDSDGDGVYDFEDKCPDAGIGPKGDPTSKGCPAKDSDGDGVFDFEDKCPNDKPGLAPDAAAVGCPAPDRDGDKVPDDVDACPDKAGAPDPDPKKNGCPGLVEVKEEQIVILQQVYFDTAKDVIQKRSFQVLDSVAYALKTHPNIKKVLIEGHTDDRGSRDKNVDLSKRRASSVMRFMIAKGIEGDRLQAEGYGPDKPIASNKTSAGRQLNRRVVFTILDPAPKAPAAAPAPAQ